MKIIINKLNKLQFNKPLINKKMLMKSKNLHKRKKQDS